MTGQHLATREEWLAARMALLEREKAHTRERDALAAARRALPLVKVEKAYRFETPEGEQSLADLFGPHGQLVIYHFMFGADWTEGCPSCSFWADCFDGIDVHLAARDTGFLAVSNAPLDRLLAYKARMGWGFRWVSAGGSGFSEDFGVTFPGGPDLHPDGYNYGGRPHAEEMPGLSVFVKGDDGTVCHSYSAYARGIDAVNCAYQILDLTPGGRDEDGLEFSMAWVRRRDRY